VASLTGWTKANLDLAKAGDMLRDYATPCKGDPVEAAVYRDRQGRHRRITALYPEGWSLRVNFALNGKVSSFSLLLSLIVKAAK
jgi:hypothetical protein